MLVSVILLLYVYYKDEIDTFVTRRHTCNKIDGRCYNTVGKFNNQEKASELLAHLNKFCLSLMKHLRNKYIWNNHPNTEAKEIVEFLIFNYNPDGIIENAPTNDINTSYVDDKGKVFAICLREKTSGNNEFQDIHDLEYVVIHEMTHMATKSYGHENDFWVNFKFLLNEALEAGLHEPRNYYTHPINYCSLHVDYNPYFDDNLKNIYLDF